VSQPTNKETKRRESRGRRYRTGGGDCRQCVGGEGRRERKEREEKKVHKK